MKPRALLFAEGQYEAALPLFVEELDRLRQQEPGHELIRTLGEYAICCYELERLAEARAALEEALALCREKGEEANEAAATTLHELALVRSAEGDTEEAIEICRQSLRMELAEGGEATVQMHTLAILLQHMSRNEEALQILQVSRDSLEAKRDVEGVGKCLNEMGLTHMALGDVVNAVRCMVDSVLIKHRIGYHQGIDNTLNNLHACLDTYPEILRHGEARNALERLRRALA